MSTRNDALPRHVETVVIGAGQAGLVMRTFLQAAGREHLLLDRRGGAAADVRRAPW